MIEYLNNSLLFSIIFDLKNNELKKLYVLDKKEVETFVKLEQKGVTFEGKVLNKRDRDLLDAIYSIYCTGNMTFNDYDVVKFLYADKNRRVSSNEMKKIRKSIMYLRSVDIAIDCTNEFKARGLDYEGTIFSSCLPLDVLEIKKNGKKLYYYSFKDEIPTHKYASYIKQMIALTSDMFKHKTRLRVNEETSMIERYLLRRIQNMVNGKMKSRRISFQRFDAKLNEKGLFVEIGLYEENYPTTWRKKKKQVIDKANALVHEYKEKGLIKDYKKIYSENRKNSQIGIEIIV